ncbi:hypothetical protein V5799_006348, partial [Amblyomma americanum]
MNSDSDDSDSEEAARLSALSSDDSDEEPLPQRNPRKKRKCDEQDFSWKKEFKPQDHAFDPSSSGICNDIIAASSELEIFESLFTPDIVEGIVDQTNIFQRQVHAALTPTAGSRIHQWKDMTSRAGGGAAGPHSPAGEGGGAEGHRPHQEQPTLPTEAEGEGQGACAHRAAQRGAEEGRQRGSQ